MSSTQPQLPWWSPPRLFMASLGFALAFGIIKWGERSISSRGERFIQDLQKKDEGA